MSDLSLTIDETSRLAVNPNLVLRIEADDCGLLFDPDSGQVQMLNETAIHVWQQLDGRRTLREILDRLHESYTDMPTDADQQVFRLVEHLARLGAIGAWESA